MSKTVRRKAKTLLFPLLVVGRDLGARLFSLPFVCPKCKRKRIMPGTYYKVNRKSSHRLYRCTRCDALIEVLPRKG